MTMKRLPKSLQNIKRGDRLFWNVITHDDGVESRGGVMGECIGKMGSGKSTALLQIAQSTCHAPKNMTRYQAKRNNALIPETVLWRGRGLDHWNVLIPERWAKSFPNSYAKPLRVFVHCDSDYRFIENYGDRAFCLNETVDIILYETPADIYANILVGGINVIYEPAQYMIPPEIVNEILSDKLKALFPIGECPATPAPSPVWWFEFIRFLIQNKDKYEYFTIIMDEAHEVIPAYAKGDHWHLVDKFGSRTVIEMRKKNITFIPATHGLNLLDFRTNQRSNYFLWFRGSKTHSGYSRIKQALISALPENGYFFVEDSLSEFGYVPFDRIPKQPPLLEVEGMQRIF